MLVSVDFPFAEGWHELCGCYRSAGWKQLSRTPCHELNDHQGGFVEAGYQMTESGDYGHLVYGLVSSDNQTIIPPQLDGGLGAPLFEQLMMKMKRRRPEVGNKNFQVQVFAIGRERFEDAQSEQLKELFFLARQEFRKKLERVTSDEWRVTSDEWRVTSGE